MPGDEEVVLTSRRAWRGREAVRLRLSDRAIALTGAAPLTIPLAEVREVRLVRRRWIEVRTDATTVRFRCFGAPAIAALLAGLRESG